MKIVASIEARCGSTRLPNKIFKEIIGKPSLALMIERVRQSKLIDEVVIATTDSPRDDKVEQLCEKLDIRCFRGSEDDVLDRVVKAVESVKGDIIVELTGDCTLMDPALVDRMVSEYLKDTTIDYLSNTNPYTWPEGFDVQIFSLNNLKWVNDNIVDTAVHEHVSLYFYEVEGRYKTKNISWEEKSKWHPDWHLSLDEQHDLEVITKVYEHLYPQNPLFTVADVVEFLESNPGIKMVNEKVGQKEVR